jgi:hypothetical protein
MTTLTDLQAKWEARRNDPVVAKCMVSMEAICIEVLADFASLAAAAVETVTLTEASVQGGYSVDHLQRCVASGKIENVGKKGRPRIRRADVPLKPGYLPTGTAGDQLSDRRRIVAAARHQEAVS